MSGACVRSMVEKMCSLNTKDARTLSWLVRAISFSQVVRNSGRAICVHESLTVRVSVYVCGGLSPLRRTFRFRVGGGCSTSIFFLKR